MSAKRFRQALVLLGLVMLVAIGSIISSGFGPSHEEKEAMAKANAELLERRHKSPQYRLERALMVVDKQFPGECGADAKLTYLPNGDVSVKCRYDETFAIGPNTPAIRCIGLIKPPTACLVR